MLPALNVDRAMVGLDDALTKRQPHAHALWLGRDEGLEQPIAYFRRDAGAGIGDAELDHIFGGKFANDDGQMTRLAGRIGDERVDRVAKEIHQDLLDLNGIDLDLRVAGRLVFTTASASSSLSRCACSAGTAPAGVAEATTTDFAGGLTERADVEATGGVAVADGRVGGGVEARTGVEAGDAADPAAFDGFTAAVATAATAVADTGSPGADNASFCPS